MSKTPKLIVANGPFEVYRAGHVLIIQRDGEFHCNLRKADRGFADPAAWIADILRVEAEVAAEGQTETQARRARVDAYLAERADRAAAQPGFAF